MIEDALTGAGTTLLAEITPALTVAVPVGIAILAATIGWKVFKRFARG